MSRKRSRKKQEKRRAAALAELEELARRGADDEFLARAVEAVGDLGDLAASPLAEVWNQVADRALRRSLAGADLARVERLLRALRRGGRPRPQAALAEAVLDLAAGRLEEARAKLATLAAAAPEPAAGALPPGLVAALRALAQDGPDGGGAAAPPELRELDRLRGLAAGDGGARGAAGASLRHPYLRAAGEFVRALQGFEARAYAPTAAGRQALDRRLRALRAAAPAGEAELGRLLAAAELRLSLLADLAALQARLASPRERSGPRASRAVTDWLRGPGKALAAALADPGPALLAPLHHAVRAGWRAVVERVAARAGTSGLAELDAAEPRLLAGDVDLPDGAQGGLADLRQHARARQALAAGRWDDLVRLLRARSRSETRPGDLAALWSLELWAWNHQAAGEDEADRDDGPGEGPSEPLPHRTVVRLEEMAGEIARRFPAEQRAEVARALGEELFALCEEVSLCDHTARAALSLLDHLPGDAGLLIAGVAGAVAAGELPALRALEARLARRGPARAADGATVRRLMAQVALEDPRVLARSLDVLRPLFTDDAWPAIAALVAEEMGVAFATYLAHSGLLSAADPALGALVPDDARRQLDRLRPALAGTPGFAAVALAIDCWRPDRAGAERAVEEFLAARAGLDDALTALHVLGRALSPWVPSGVDAALRGLAHAVIDHLDDGWRRWWRDVPLLALAADRDRRRRLEKKIEVLLASPAAEGMDREILAGALDDVRQAAELRRGAGRSRRRPARRRGRATDRGWEPAEPVPAPWRPWEGPAGWAPDDLESPPPRPRRKKPRRRRTAEAQLDLDFP